MPEKISLKSLHLEYRVWIAELNFNITLIRIFHDRLKEIHDNNEESHVKDAERLEAKLSAIRAAIDSLSHRMQIEKMGIAASARNVQDIDDKISLPPNHSSIRNDFYNFRISFNELKSEFINFESSL